MPKSRKLIAAEEALTAAQSMVRVVRINRDQPRVLEERIATLQAERDRIDRQLEAAIAEYDGRHDAVETAMALLVERQQDYKRVKHAVKIERLQRLAKQLA